MCLAGGVVNSNVVPQVQAVFPQGALTKKIKVGLQVNIERLPLTKGQNQSITRMLSQVNMFRPRKGVSNGLLKKISVNHLPKKKRFSLIW